VLRVAIVGCGKIADQHVQAVSRIPGAAVVAVCDREGLMARQLAERFHLPHWYDDLPEMLRAAAPDVVHVTTPPQSHHSLAITCLEAGCHVYLEKPFTVTADEARSLIDLAERRGLKMTAGHNYQFTQEMLEMRRLVSAGFLGGRPVHLESHWTYALSDTSYVGPILASRSHWVRQLPGQLLHNLISHATARLAEFLGDDLAELVATAHQSASFKAIGGQEVLDELRVLIRDSRGTTAFLCFSTQTKPGVSQLRLYGPVNSLVVDIASGSLVRLTSRNNKSYLTYVVPPILAAREHLRAAGRNAAAFIGGRLHQDFGMKELIERFYQSVRREGPLPISYREILWTAGVMDEIFVQISKAVRTENHVAPV
jgi:predicted dehydrogenase